MTGQFPVTAQNIIDTLREIQTLTKWAYEAMDSPGQVDGTQYYFVDSTLRQGWLTSAYDGSSKSMSPAKCSVIPGGQIPVTAEDIIDTLHDADMLEKWVYEAIDNPGAIDGKQYYFVDSEWKQKWLTSAFDGMKKSMSPTKCSP